MGHGSTIRDLKYFNLFSKFHVKLIYKKLNFGKKRSVRPIEQNKIRMLWFFFAWKASFLHGKINH